MNFLATYGRSVYSIVIGLFCGRWTLMALGEVDYGLMGLIGGLTAFLSFFNSLMANAIGRYFAFSVGQAQTNPEEGVEECRKWFNVALLIHTVIPLVGLFIGYPLGVWVIGCFLTIPADRIVDCIWVWRWVCLSCFLTMVSLPFNAMYQAKQYIAELTIYSFVTTTLNACFLYYMVTHPGVWLAKMAFWTAFLTIAPQLIIAARAVKIFPECRFVPRYLWSWPRMKELSIYAFYRFFGALSIMIRRQGVDILVNKYLGPSKNAAVNVAGTVSGHCNSLAGALLGALSPAITSAYGAGDMKRVHTLCYSACKYSTIMVLIFILPLLLEAEEVFRLWLIKPPEGAVPMCLCLMMVLAMENLSCGLYMPVFADGRIRGYQIAVLFSGVVAVPIAWLLLVQGYGVVAIGLALVVSQILVVIVRMYFARRVCQLSMRPWMSQIFMPIMGVAVLSLAAGGVVRILCEPSLLRLVIVTALTNFLMIPLSYLIVLTKDEKTYFVNRLCAKFGFLGKVLCPVCAVGRVVGESRD